MEKFVISLIVCSLTMTFIAFMYELLSKFLRKVQSSKWRYYGWILIFVGYIAVFKPSFGSAAVTVTIGEWYNTVRAGGRIMSSDALNDPFVFYVIFIVWLAGFLSGLCYFAVKQRRFIKGVNRISKPASSNISRMVKKIVDELGINSNFKIITLTEITSPMVTGMFSPLLILPERRYEEEELYLILKHEIVHLKRHDLFVKAFMIFCGTVHWFNPFVRRFIRRAEREGELFCDETVIGNESETMKKLYCRSILDTVSAGKKTKASLSPALASNFYFNKSGLKHRMSMILSLNKKYSLGIVGVLVLVLILYAGRVLAFSDNTDYRDEDVAQTTFLVTEPSEVNINA